MFKTLQHRFPVSRQVAMLWLRRYGWRLSFLGVFTVFLLHRDFEVQLNFNTVTADFSTHFAQTTKNTEKEKLPVAIHASQNNGNKTGIAQQRDYIKRFARTAQEEMHKYGIPASITLAQGLLESGVGASPLATKNNNHFGIKCFSKKCKKGHCRNFSDDHHKDFFRVYASAWESYRAHSLFLQQDRYKDLFDLPRDDYRAWAYGLKKAGYATDERYPEKLIRLIESLGLGEFDG